MKVGIFLRDNKILLIKLNFTNFAAKIIIAEVAELVDALDSKSSLAHTRCRFESGLRYKIISDFKLIPVY